MSRQSEKEQGVLEAVTLFRLCQKAPTVHNYEQFVHVMALHGLNEKNLDVTEETLKELERSVHHRRATGFVESARNGLVNLHLVEELQTYLVHGILSEEEIGLRPGEFEGFKVEAMKNREVCMRL